jgi:hypothetical protein
LQSKRILIFRTCSVVYFSSKNGSKVSKQAKKKKNKVLRPLRRQKNLTDLPNGAQPGALLYFEKLSRFIRTLLVRSIQD